MIKVAVSQRVELSENRLEQRDVLDQNISSFLHACGFMVVPVPNTCETNIDKNLKGNNLNYFLDSIKPDAILLSGGNDIGKNPQRDKIENAIMNYAEQKKLPLLGICRGMQMIANRLGISTVPILGHAGTRHKITGEICGTVNSYHNYCISDCPKNYRVISKSEENSIEAIKHSELPWEGWMWHPEREATFNTRDMERLKLLFRN